MLLSRRGWTLSRTFYTDITPLHHYRPDALLLDSLQLHLSIVNAVFICFAASHRSFRRKDVVEYLSNVDQMSAQSKSMHMLWER